MSAADDAREAIKSGMESARVSTIHALGGKEDPHPHITEAKNTVASAANAVSQKATDVKNAVTGGSSSSSSS